MTDADKTPIVLVTGVSGAGKSSALKQLEDLGYEAVDNMPISMIFRLAHGLDNTDEPHPLAIGIDIRTRDFDAANVLALMERLSGDPGLSPSLLFVDCDDDTIIRRYKETRRRHPLAADRTVADGILVERRMIEPLRARADRVIDTTEYAMGDFKVRMAEAFSLGKDPGLAIFVMSFSFKRGLPRDADLVFDVRFFQNPYYDLTLRPLTGQNPAVQEHIQKDPAFTPFYENLVAMTGPLLPRYRSEGKSYLTIAFGCTGGRHRSVFLAETYSKWLTENGWTAQLRHRDLDKA